MAPFLRRKQIRPNHLAVVFCAVPVALFVPPAAAEAVTLSITVQDVRNSDGWVSVDLCLEEQFLGDECPYNAIAEASQGETVVVFEDVPPGVYGVQGFHDENANETMDQNLVGWPLEGFAFANDPRILFRAPKFEDSSIAVTDDNVETQMRMRYR